MFAKQIIDSDAFLDLPLSTQATYFHLSMRADDDGFLNNAKRIMRTIGANQNDYDLLKAKRFILDFEDGIIVIKHWKMHNYIQKDRYKKTIYQEHLSQLELKENKSYTEADVGLEYEKIEVIEAKKDKKNDEKTEWIQNGYNLYPQDRLGKDRLYNNIYGQNDVNDVSNDKVEVVVVDIVDPKLSFEKFWEVYPRKVAKQNAYKWFLKHKPNEELLEKILTAIEKYKKTEQWQKDGGQFVPHPTTWLNGKRWEDEIIVSATKSNNKKTAPLPNWYDDYEKDLKAHEKEQKKEALTDEEIQEILKEVKEVF